MSKQPTEVISRFAIPLANGLDRGIFEHVDQPRITIAVAKPGADKIERQELTFSIDEALDRAFAVMRGEPPAHMPVTVEARMLAATVLVLMRERAGDMAPEGGGKE